MAPPRSLDVALAAAAALFAYLGTLESGFVYDDRYVVLENPLVRGHDAWGLLSTSYWGGLVDAGLYRPLTLLSFGIQDLLGAGAFGFHLVNDVLHAAVSALVVLAAATLGASRWTALAAGLLFALHPVQAEAVNALVGRAEILALLFVLAALVAHLRRAHPLWVSGLLLLALGSKESAVFGLALFPLHGIVFERSLSTRRLLPVAAPLALYLLVRVLVLGGLGVSGREVSLLDNPAAHAEAPARLWTAAALVFEYGRLVIFPGELSADYSFEEIPVATSPLDARALLGALAIAALLGLAVAAVKRGDPLPGFAALAFLVPLGGFLHLLFPLGTMMAERLLYLPMFGASLLGGAAVGALVRRRRRATVVVFALVLLACAARVVQRSRDWRSDEALFRKTVQTSPRSARSHFLLGAWLLERRRFSEAAGSFETGLAILPRHFEATMSLGQSLLGAGRPADALDAFERALAMAPPSDAGAVRVEASEAAIASGLDEARRGDLATARRMLERAYELRPSARSANELGAVLGASGDLDEAERWHERALELAPGNALAWNYLGVAAERRGDPARARRRYERALELDESLEPAVRNLAGLASSLGELEEAESLYRRALELAPDSYEAYNGLGIALARRGLTREARRAFERAVEIDPTQAAARRNLLLLSEDEPR